MWAGLGEVSAGVQKAFYSRDVAAASRPVVSSRSNPWLYNATAAGTINSRLSVYASYARGIEESGNAPETAVNRGEGSPASLTKQIDAGLRFALTPAVKLVAGVFEVKKPYFDIDTARVFRQVGDVTHRGVELSLTGQVAPGLTVVAGTVFLRARRQQHHRPHDRAAGTHAPRLDAQSAIRAGFVAGDLSRYADRKHVVCVPEPQQWREHSWPHRGQSRRTIPLHRGRRIGDAARPGAERDRRIPLGAWQQRPLKRVGGAALFRQPDGGLLRKLARTRLIFHHFRHHFVVRSALAALSDAGHFIYPRGIAYDRTGTWGGHRHG